MDEEKIDPRLFPTLVSLWSAMLGGAAGAMVGLTSMSLLWIPFLGFCGGFMCSVPLCLLTLGIGFTFSSMMGMDFDEAPVGCSSSSQMSGGLGGITGMVAAVFMAQIASVNQVSDPRTVAICWSVSTLVPVVLSIVLAYTNIYDSIEHWWKQMRPPRDDLL